MSQIKFCFIVQKKEKIEIVFRSNFFEYRVSNEKLNWFDFFAFDFVVDCFYIRRVEVMFSFFVFIEYRSFASHIISEKNDINLIQNREEFASIEKIELIEKIEKNRLHQSIEKTSKFRSFFVDWCQCQNQKRLRCFISKNTTSSNF